MESCDIVESFNNSFGSKRKYTLSPFLTAGGSDIFAFIHPSVRLTFSLDIILKCNNFKLF